MVVGGGVVGGGKLRIVEGEEWKGMEFGSEGEWMGKVREK